MTTNEIIAQLTARIENMEATIATLSAKKATRRAKELTPQEANDLRLKINAASRASKLKARASALNMTVPEYQKYQADKKAGLLTVVAAADTKPAGATVETTPEEQPAPEAPAPAEVPAEVPAEPAPTEEPAVKELPEIALEELAASAPSSKGKSKGKKSAE